jgi:DNA-binding MarR family transcriptional regulator
MADISDSQYRVLLVFRTALRRFLQWSAAEAAKVGLTSQQHQLLLAVRAHPGPERLSIGQIAEYLLIRHHSAVELVNRAEAAGLVTRGTDGDDQRVVRLALTEEGERLVEELSMAHLAELERVTHALNISEDLLERLSQQFSETLPTHPHERSPRG